jgi:hypothetical protein
MGKYDLVGVDGNAFSIMGYVSEAMRQENKTGKEIKAYVNEAMSSDYDNLLRVSINIIEELNKTI